MDKKTMKLLKQLISDAPEKIEEARKAVIKEVSKSVNEGEEGEEHDRRRN